MCGSKPDLGIAAIRITWCAAPVPTIASIPRTICWPIWKFAAARVLDHPELKSIDLNIVHDIGPFNGLAAIAGSVIDQTGAAIPGATADVREVSSGKARRDSANAAGQFSLAGLPPGDYEVRVSSPGFQSAAQRFKLTARDRAVVSVVLQIGAMSEMVVVADGPRAIPMAMPGAIRMGGNATFQAGVGGVIGGVSVGPRARA